MKQVLKIIKEIIYYIVSDYSGVKLELKSKRTTESIQTYAYWTLNCQNDHCIIEKISLYLLLSTYQMKMKTQLRKFGIQQRQFEEEIL
jgi:hypothetical protein